MLSWVAPLSFINPDPSAFWTSPLLRAHSDAPVDAFMKPESIEAIVSKSLLTESYCLFAAASHADAIAETWEVLARGGKAPIHMPTISATIKEIM